MGGLLGSAGRNTALPRWDQCDAVSSVSAASDKVGDSVVGAAATGGALGTPFVYMPHSNVTEWEFISSEVRCSGSFGTGAAFVEHPIIRCAKIASSAVQNTKEIPTRRRRQVFTW